MILNGLVKKALAPASWKDARTWGMLCHLAGLAGFTFLVGNVILPLIFWQLKKDQHPFVELIARHEPGLDRRVDPLGQRNGDPFQIQIPARLSGEHAL